tara:strand:+ start:582 stop:746 length:165 start_codon:yes stop_codon:yes gene_type:complete
VAVVLLLIPVLEQEALVVVGVVRNLEMAEWEQPIPEAVAVLGVVTEEMEVLELL